MFRSLNVAMMAIVAVACPLGPTTEVKPVVYAYELPFVARVDVGAIGAVETAAAQLDDAQEGSASAPAAAQSASTTSSAGSVAVDSAEEAIANAASKATNTAGGLGDDFARALDDIDNGTERTNVRNSKSFGNDGRGGTTRLPEADAGGNPISYTEHTVNPRPPGGALDGSRIVVGSGGIVWTTADHFVTWM